MMAGFILVAWCVLSPLVVLAHRHRMITYWTAVVVTIVGAVGVIAAILTAFLTGA